jgi:L-lactate dehydrogenase complex protein LldG
MVPVEDTSPAALQSRFVQGAGALGFTVTSCADPKQAIERILVLIAPDHAIQRWDFAHIPLPGLAEALVGAEIQIAPGDASVRIGLTGVDAALAGTGSLILVSGPGKPRQPSLVPPVHIAIVTADQIVPSFDSWAAAQTAGGFQDLRSSSSVVVISGPSRTGDIANIPVRGVHGPGVVHIFLLEK